MELGRLRELDVQLRATQRHPPRDQDAGATGRVYYPAWMDRVEKVLHAIDLSGRGLELGPSYNPIVPKSRGRRIETVDHAPADELVAKYTALGLAEEMLDAIEPVDHLWTGGSLLDVVPDHGGYDYIIASHFIEHTVDMVRFLADCEVLLRDGGRLSLVIPDKRYCFDRFKPLSTLGDVIDAHHAGTRFHTAGAMVDHEAYACLGGGALTWSPGSDAAVELQFPNLDGVAEAIRRGLEQQAYHDVHRWMFTPTSFDLLIGDLAELGHHSFGEVASFPTYGFEFFATLAKGAPRAPRTRLAMLQAIEDELSHTAAEDGSTVARLLRENARLTHQISDLQASTSWRITAPLRSAMTGLRAMRAG